MVTRLNYFKAQDGKGEALFAELRKVVPMISGSVGSISCKAIQREDAFEEVVIIEEWETVEAHKAALTTVPQEVFGPVMALLAEPPHGAYYNNS